MTNHKFDAVVLAAAVSDYGVMNESNEKIRSKDNLTIQLYPLPKIINRIKRYQPETFLVGFKMFVGASSVKLYEQARKSIKENNCDLVIANNWKEQTRAMAVKADNTFRPLVDKAGTIVDAATRIIELIECGISSSQLQAQ